MKKIFLILTLVLVVISCGKTNSTSQSEPYKQGLLNGNSYLSIKEQFDSLSIQIKDREITFKDLVKYKAVSVSGWRDLRAIQDDISKMKKKRFFLEADMNIYKKRDSY